MYHGAFALLERSLRIDARGWSNHLARLGLLITIYVSLLNSLVTSMMFGAPGLRFFYGIAYLDATFMTLLGVGFFATSISEEKEEDTLGLMLMAGISPLGILLGKSVGRLWQAVLLIAAQYPFVLLAVTMGGVMQSQIWAVTIALLAYMLFLAGFGLLCSTIAPRNQSAVFWMVIGLLIYFFVPLIAKNYVMYQQSMSGQFISANRTIWWMFLEGLSNSCVFIQMGSILSTGFGESPYSIQVITNSLVGIVCAGLSWLLFGLVSREPSTEAATRGLVPSNPRSLFSTGLSRKGSSSFRLSATSFINPFVWKDFHFVSGGYWSMLIRCAYYTGLGFLALMFESNNDDEWFGMCIFLMYASIPIDAARVVSRSLQEEVRGQTLAPLMLLPRSSTGIVYSKLGGALLGWLPAPVISFIVTISSPNMREIMGELSSEMTGSGMLLVMLILYFALVPHFAALLALYVRWGAVGLAIALTIGVYFFMSMGMVFFMMFASGSFGPEILTVYYGVFAFTFFSLCVACHMGVLLRVQALAAR